MKTLPRLGRFGIYPLIAALALGPFALPALPYSKLIVAWSLSIGLIGFVAGAFARWCAEANA